MRIRLVFLFVAVVAVVLAFEAVKAVVAFAEAVNVADMGSLLVYYN
jgi:hypothetical protein